MRSIKLTAAMLATVLYTFLALRVLFLSAQSPLPGVCYMIALVFFLAALTFGAYAHVRLRIVR